MRVLVISGDWNAFTEKSPVAARFRMQARTVERLDILVPNGPRELVQLSGNCAARGFGYGKLVGALRTVAAGIRIARPDVISAQDPFFLGAIAWMIARMRGSRLHLQVHTDLYAPKFKTTFKQRVQLTLARFLLAQADAVRAVSEKVAGPLHSRGVANVSVLPVYVDLTGLETAKPLDRSRFAHFKKIVLVVARLEPEKQVDRAIRVMSDVIQASPETGLVIVGGGSERAKLEVLAESLGVQSQVVFEGAQDPFPYFKAADLMLATSKYEGYGMAVIEALAAGCPVVSFDVGVAREAGAIIASEDDMPSVAVAVLSEGKRGKLTMRIPTESEYPDLWYANLASALGMRAMRSKEVTPTVVPSVGFIGQGFIGKAYSDEFESRGIKVTRYALEEPYRGNKDKIKECDIVFIAVPTPTTEQGFDGSIVREAVGLVGTGKTAVIKSTMLPGSTNAIAEAYLDRFVVHSPEFLREATAAYDAAHPDRNIIGIPSDSPEYRERAQAVIRILPSAPFELVCSAKEAELTKYAANNWLFLKVVYTNMIYDLAEKIGAQYSAVRDGLAADPRIGRSHLDPVHQSGHGGKAGRGAGGHCFIKDFEAMRELYEETVDDAEGKRFLGAAAAKNIELLRESGKDIDLLKGVYGEDLKKRIDTLGT